MPDKRTLDDILKDDHALRRFIEINLDVLSNIAKVQFGMIEHLPVKDGKLLVKRQEISISGSD